MAQSHVPQTVFNDKVAKPHYFSVSLVKAILSKMGLLMLICYSRRVAHSSLNLLFLAVLEYPAITHTEKLFDGFRKSGCTKGTSCANQKINTGLHFLKKICYLIRLRKLPSWKPEENETLWEVRLSICTGHISNI